MKTNRRHFLIGGAATIAASSIIAPRSSAAASPKTLVELFTSQGCHSCPPAEAYLKELSSRPDIISLEFHVDYWDYIGWKDPFADPLYTQRQRNYNTLFGSPYNYTPQMVIDGRAHEVGSRRSAVAARIDSALMKREMDEKEKHPPELSAEISATGSLDFALKGHPVFPDSYDILMISIDHSHQTDVKRGENSGKRLHNTHVVRNLKTVAKGWSGGDVAGSVHPEDLFGNGGHVLIVQSAKTGRIALVDSFPA